MTLIIRVWSPLPLNATHPKIRVLKVYIHQIVLLKTEITYNLYQVIINLINDIDNESCFRNASRFQLTRGCFTKDFSTVPMDDVHIPCSKRVQFYQSACKKTDNDSAMFNNVSSILLFSWDCSKVNLTIFWL